MKKLTGKIRIFQMAMLLLTGLFICSFLSVEICYTEEILSSQFTMIEFTGNPDAERDEICSYIYDDDCCIQTRRIFNSEKFTSYALLKDSYVFDSYAANNKINIVFNKPHKLSSIPLSYFNCQLLC
ncbi:MAG TPA: hypothetical protein DD381_13880 [Lentisphaeria bacterium]|nr:MAG: hypothetical protein A2X47_13645 [Lentisphaerae bacterium GWF2_38_69]HBM17412.1 hypothetical protein [Lentisphaeria bacterium]